MTSVTFDDSPMTRTRGDRGENEQRLSTRIERSARFGAVAVLVVLAAQSVWAARGLVADGSFYLWSVLSSGSFFLYPSRFLAQLVTQAPLLGAITAGVRDVPTLARIESFGTGALPVLLWAVALLVLRRKRSFWMFVVAFAVTFLNSGFISVGEYNLAYGLVALSAALIIAAPGHPVARVALLLSAVVLIASYESLVYLGPALIVLAIIHRRALGRPWFWMLVGTYGLAVVYSTYWILFPRDASNFGSAADVLYPLHYDQAFGYSLLVAGLFVVLWLFAPPLVQRIGTVLMVAGCLFIVVAVPWPEPWMHYASRALAGVALFVVLLCVGFREVRPRAKPDSRSLSIAALALLVALSIPFAYRTEAFTHWLAQFDAVTVQQGGLTALDSTTLPVERTHIYGWTYTNPYLSMLLHTGEGQRVILNPGQATTDPGAGAPAPIEPRFANNGPLYG
ncbi:hypothetical protein [Subtercola endophyticus]|uniref:hypothetical protein n=1 Tax=Subtercola endophyticus TaxID=2895559 RepID=UPI001E4235C1|nr:hypothetical protein [Subtercola endophyticus]UFS60788.1 hypothetical protein LQ955_08665 [Subtercola endophyticus]